MRHPKPPMICCNSLILNLCYVMAQECDEVRKNRRRIGRLPFRLSTIRFQKNGMLVCCFSEAPENISFFRTSRGDYGEKRPGAHHCLVCSGPFLLQIPRVCQQDASFYPVSQRTAKSRFLKGVSGGKIRLSIRILA